jgi:hypothetical protein
MRRISIVEDEFEMLRNLTTIIRLEKLRPRSALPSPVNFGAVRKAHDREHDRVQNFGSVSRRDEDLSEIVNVGYRNDR